MIRNLIALVVISGAMTGPVRGQDPDTTSPVSSITILAKSYGDSVVLRWAPSDARLWRYSNRYGYLLTRYRLSELVVDSEGFVTQLTDSAIKPWAIHQWEHVFLQGDTLAAVGAELLYGEVYKADLSKGINLEEIMQQKADEDSRHAYALILSDISPLVATGMGLRFVDRKFERGMKYVYTVHTLPGDPAVTADTGFAFVDMDEPPPEMSLHDIAIDELDRSVRFSWNSWQSSRLFSAYHLERSDDGGKTFHRTTSFPVVQQGTGVATQITERMFLFDSLAANYILFHFRIIGITPFGEFVECSPVLAAMGRDRTPPSPPEQVTASNTFANHVNVSWTKGIRESDFLGFHVARSENLDGPFSLLTPSLLPPTAREFVDTHAVSHAKNFYIVTAYDTAGNSASSIPAYAIMQDTIPPSRPRGLTGTIDTVGIVRLQWNLGPEPDLFGYLVYSSNARYHEFVPVTRGFLADTTFTDTVSLRTLTKSVFYTIIAFDRNRRASFSSDTLELKRPDKVPPVSPVFTDFLVADTSVSMYWNPSSSEDVVRQLVYRKAQEGDWKELVVLGPQEKSFNDTAVERSSWYEYAIEAEDEAGLRSERSFPLRVRVYDSGLRPYPARFRARINEDRNGIILEWDYPNAGPAHIVIYRGVADQGLRMFDAASAGATSFTDRIVSPNESYTYAIKAIYADGGESRLTEPIRLSLVR